MNILNQDLYYLNLYIYTLRKTFVDSVLPFSPLLKLNENRTKDQIMNTWQWKMVKKENLAQESNTKRVT